MGDTPDDRGASAGETAGKSRCPTGAWLREALVTLALGGLVLFMVFAMRGGREARVGALPAHAVAPDVEVELAAGGQAALSGHRGIPVVLVFWATWCGACREEMPDLDRLTRESEGRYAVMAVSREAPNVLARFASQRRLVVPMGSDLAGRSFADYGVTSLPTTVIIDAEGRVVHDFSGGASYSALRAQMDRLTPP